MKAQFFARISSFLLLAAACNNQVQQQAANTIQQGKELQVVPSQQEALRYTPFADFIFSPSQHTFEEVDAYYREHLSMQAGHSLHHDNHNIAIQVIFEHYDLLSRDTEQLVYYWEEMNRLDWVITSLIPYYKETADKLLPTLGQATVQAKLQQRHLQNKEQVTQRFTEHSPEFVPEYLQVNDGLIR